MNIIYYIYGTEGSVCSLTVDTPNLEGELNYQSMIIHSYSLN